MENPNRTKGRNGGGKDHESIPDKAGNSFWSSVAEDFLRVHHEKKSEISDGDERAAQHGSGDGESGVGAFPNKREADP